MTPPRTPRAEEPSPPLLSTPGLGRAEALWLLMVVMTPLFVNLWVEQQFEASKMWLARTLIWLLALVWLRGWLAGRRFRPLTPTVGKVAVALALVLALATLLSPHPYIALFGSLDRANGLLTQLSFLLLFAIVAAHFDPDQHWRLVHIALLTALPICALGLVQAAGWQPLSLLTDGRSPLVTTLGRANFTGAYLALLLPLMLAAARSAQARWKRAAFYALLALTLGVIVLAQARAALIGAGVGMGLFFWLRTAPGWSRSKRWFSGLIGVAAVGAALGLVLQKGLVSGGSIAARWTIWRTSLDLLWPRLWLGYGADTLDLHFPAVYPPQLVYYQGRGVVVDRAHNWLLDWSLNYGVVATVLFAALVFLVLRQGWQYLCESAAPQTRASPVRDRAGPPKDLPRPLLAAYMASICAHLVGNLFLFDVAATALLFWLFLGVVAASTAKARPTAVFGPLPLWGRRTVMALGVVVFLLAVWATNLRPLLADVHSWRGTQALGRGDMAVAVAEYAAAVATQPNRAEYHVALALTAAQLGDFGRAENAIGQAIYLRPTDPVMFTQLAALYANWAQSSPERIESAYAAYEKAVVLAPTTGLTYRQYADLRVRTGDWAGAQPLAQRAVDLDATDGVAYAILGWANLQIGDPSAAHHAFAQAVKWQPDVADHHLGLALASYQLGRLDQARAALDRTLQLDPTYAPELTGPLHRALQGE